MSVQQIDAHPESHRSDFSSRLNDLIRIPSISAQPAHNADTLVGAAEFVRDDLRQRACPPS